MILIWFTVIGLLGLGEVLKDPAVVQGLLPSWAVRFMVDHGAGGYLVLGGVVLAVTGAEALYADRGHFGAGPIRLGWFGLALPALMLNYLGQAVFILHHPTLAKEPSTFNPFYQMAPTWILWPLVVLAAMATVIASQAVIFRILLGGQTGRAARLSPSGQGPAYMDNGGSQIRTGGQLDAVHRRRRAGGHFPSRADKLMIVFEVTVAVTFILNTLLFLAVARLIWKTSKWKLAPLAVLFLLTIEVVFFSSNIAKIGHGAWLSLAVGLADVDGDDQLAARPDDRHSRWSGGRRRGSTATSPQASVREPARRTRFARERSPGAAAARASHADCKE